MKNEDDVSEEEIIRRICCSVYTFFVSNCCWGFLSALLLLVGLIGLLLAGTELAVFPLEVYITSIAFAGYTFAVIAMGCFGTCSRVELCFILYILFASIGLIGQVCGFAYLMLYTIDVGGYNDVNSPLVEGPAFLQSHFEAVRDNNLGVWIDVQNNLECCGINFELGLELIDNIELFNETESGNLCLDTRDELQELRDNLVNEDDLDEEGNIVEVVDNADFGLQSEYFCMSKTSAILSDIFPVIIVIVVLFVLAQLFSLVSAGRMYWVPEFLGGWALDEEAMTDIAEHKGIKLAIPEGGYSGGRVLSTIRNAGANVTYRLQNAVTTDPRADPDAGIFKRLSTNRAVSFLGAAPSNPRPEEGGEEQENSGGRTNSVRSMLSMISKGLGRAPKSLIDTNAMGINSTNTSPPGLGGPPGVPKQAQAAAASTRNEEVNTQSKLLTSFMEDQDSGRTGGEVSLDI